MTETPTRCPSTATIEPGGALVRCTLDTGHDVDRPWLVENGSGATLSGTEFGTLHQYVLTWGNPAGVDIDPDIYDPDETFDLEVDIDPSIAGRYVCPECADGKHWRCSEPGVCNCMEEVDDIVEPPANLKPVKVGQLMRATPHDIAEGDEFRAMLETASPGLTSQPVRADPAYLEVPPVPSELCGQRPYDWRLAKGHNGGSCVYIDDHRGAHSWQG